MPSEIAFLTAQCGSFVCEQLENLHFRDIFAISSYPKSKLPLCLSSQIPFY